MMTSAIFDKLDDVLLMDYPSRLDVLSCTCLKGSCRLGINLEEYTLEPRTDVHCHARSDYTVFQDVR
ncbi:MAG: hypothetical protein R2738_04035 [Bacteroides graminisolvens]